MNSENSGAINVCGCVVLFHPGIPELSNLAPLSKNVKKLFAIDNTGGGGGGPGLDDAVKSLGNIEIIRNPENLGIAKALNQAAALAINEKYDFLLTMDQDTEVPEDYVKNLFAIIKANSVDMATVGIISPSLLVSTDKIEKSPIEISEKLVVMTSGNILNLSAYAKAGPFLDQLFIDRVDCEYCLRLKANGFRVIQANNIALTHSLGKVTEHRLFNKRQYPTNHSPLRRYYITRNTFFVLAKYKDRFPEYVRFERRILIREFLLILLFEREKLLKIKNIVRGYFDYRRNVFGKYPNRR